MTEAQWLASDNVVEMYSWLSRGVRTRRKTFPKMTPRLASLFAVACVHALPPADDAAFVRETAATVERFADGDVSVREIEELGKLAHVHCVRSTAGGVYDTVPHFWALAALRLTDHDIQRLAVHVPLFLTKALEGSPGLAELKSAFADALRDVVGNPFRGGRGRLGDEQKSASQLVLRSSWRSDTVLSLARVMYDRRDFSGMPVLADALQEAGCDSEAVLDHCRAGACHVRGCWVVDLVLWKE